MPSGARWAVASAALLTSCSLFVDLDGLSGGGSGTTCDGGTCLSQDGATGPQDGAADGAPGQDGGSITYAYSDVTDIANWERFDLHPYVSDDAGDYPSFAGAVSDGRYVYFPPFQIGYTGTNSTLVLRYDSTGAFTDIASWTAYDLKAVDPNAAAFGGDGFDGRYVYFTPGYTTITLRYDTTADFASASSWSKIDLGPVAPNTASTHAFPVGKYVYYSPNYNYMFRYDTTLPFDQASSWVGVNQVNLANANTYNFNGAVFDGANLILFPDMSAPPSEALRFDTTQQIGATTAWTRFDLAQLDAGTVLSFERDSVFDGRYAYATPNPQGATSIVERYDTQAAFNAGASWSGFDLTAAFGTSGNVSFGAYDGRYFYVVSYGGNHLLRFDTSGSFGDKASWTDFLLDALPGDATFGFAGAGFDGQYLYFVPHGSGTIYRFHARAPK